MPTEDELRAAHCWFPRVDRVPRDPDMTTFKQEARLRQARWRGDLRMGAHANSAPNVLKGHPPRIPNGTRLTAPDAAAGKNFLTEDVAAVAEARMSAPERHQTLNPTRLRSDLLSSMPMCFNLFGELPADPDRAHRVAEALLGAEPGTPTTVRFEWSPGRTDPTFTGDRTAFDVALESGPPGEATIVGIETKYHEHAVTEPAPEESGKLDRYLQIVTNGAGGRPVFADDWEKRILGTALQQIWRDHLLVLSMLQSGRWRAGKYVLVYPRRNVSFAAAAAAYRDVLVDDSTFATLDVEELLELGPLTHDTTKGFAARYLW